MWIFTQEFLILQLHIRCDLLFLKPFQPVLFALCLAFTMVFHVMVHIFCPLFGLMCALHRRIVFFRFCNFAMHKIHIFCLQLMNRSFSDTLRLKWHLHFYRDYHILCLSRLFIKDTLHFILPLLRHLILCLL